ncbi:cupredoxin domain-containing protein [Phaeacidiphilus oryzae]|uniref:cupredoxin domain-containing protein n=1 Tax=Phaeacidiphilus oryzae TaxID=348818 RepID=UPI000561E1A2|nr:cupredoxin family copper-binding protein [Phaeacidiphilus oryzae]
MRDTEQGRAATHKRGTDRVLLATGVASAVAAVAALGLLAQSTSVSAAPATAPAARSAAQPAGGAAALAADSAAMAPAAAGAAANSSSKHVQVAIKGYAFSPASLSVHVGDTVTWTNEDTAPHTVTTTSGPKQLSSPQLQKGQSWSYTFTTAGTYSYYCAVHPDMKAKVTVLPAAAQPSPTPTTAPTPSSAPTAAPTASASPTAPGGGMSGMPTASASPTSGGGSSASCVDLNSTLLPILQHIDSAHLEESPGQQVTDLLNLDQWVKTHTVWLETVLTPTVAGAQSVLTQTLEVAIQHLNSAHLDESVGQQVTDLLNVDQWVKTHTVWAEMLLKPTEDYVTGNC